jgi:hypothetical protein
MRSVRIPAPPLPAAPRLGRLLAGLLALLGALSPAVAPGQTRAGAGAPAAGTHTVRMHLYAPEGQTLLYEGLRTIERRDGQVVVSTTYTRPGGEVVQRTEAVYEADTLASVSYRLEDRRSGEQELLDRDGEWLRMSYRAKAADAPATGSAQPAPDLRFTATVEPTILREWARLMAGEDVPFRLLVPSRQDTYRFRLRREEAPALQQPGRLIVRMEPGTWLVRQLVDAMFFALEQAPPHRLLEFRGRSSLKADDGADQDVRIVYEYPAQG